MSVWFDNEMLDRSSEAMAEGVRSPTPSTTHLQLANGDLPAPLDLFIAAPRRPENGSNEHCSVGASGSQLVLRATVSIRRPAVPSPAAPNGGLSWLNQGRKGSQALLVSVICQAACGGSTAVSHTCHMRIHSVSPTAFRPVAAVGRCATCVADEPIKIQPL